MRSTPADATCYYRCATVRNDFASRSGRCLCYIFNLFCCQYRQIHIDARHETFLFSITRTFFVRGVGSHVIGCSCCQTGYSTRKITFSCSIISMASVYRRILRGTPTYTSCSDFHTTVINNNSTAYCSVLYDRTYFICLYRRFHYVFKCSETYLVTVGRPYTIGGVSSHVIGGVLIQTCDAGVICSYASTIRGLIVVYCRILRCAPADTSFGHVRTTIGDDIAATSREGQRYILHRTSLYDRFLCLECHERVHLTSRGTVRGITFETVIIFCLGTEVVDIDMKSTFADINFRRYGIGKIVFFTVNYFHVVWYDTECV